jgi:hypothetical protein
MAWPTSSGLVTSKLREMSSRAPLVAECAEAFSASASARFRETNNPKIRSAPSTPNGYAIEYPMVASVAPPQIRRAQELVRSSERGSVRQRTAVDAGDLARGQVHRAPEREHNKSTDNEREQNSSVQTRSAFSERGRKTRTARETDGIDKQDQAEFHDLRRDLQRVGSLRAPCTECETHEQHAGHAQREPSYADVTEQITHPDHEEQEERLTMREEFVEFGEHRESLREISRAVVSTGARQEPPGISGKPFT